MEEKAITINLMGAIPEDSVAFRIFIQSGKAKILAPYAKVILCSKGVVPLTHEKTANIDGFVMFSVRDLMPMQEIGIPPEAFKAIPWLFFAYTEDTDLGFWTEVKGYELGKMYDYTLKVYKEAPTFFVKIELKDVIGAEFFSNLVAGFESEAIKMAGLKLISVEGQGTKAVTVKFQPPWHHSPIVIEWAAVWFIIKVLALAAAIIAILVILKWTFGEVGAAVVVGAEALIFLFLLLPLLGKKKESKEKEATVPRTYRR